MQNIEVLKQLQDKRNELKELYDRLSSKMRQGIQERTILNREHWPDHKKIEAIEGDIENVSNGRDYVYHELEVVDSELRRLTEHHKRDIEPQIAKDTAKLLDKHIDAFFRAFDELEKKYVETEKELAKRYTDLYKPARVIRFKKIKNTLAQCGLGR